MKKKHSLLYFAHIQSTMTQKITTRCKKNLVDLKFF